MCAWYDSNLFDLEMINCLQIERKKKNKQTNKQVDSGGSRNQLIEFIHKKLRHSEYWFNTRRGEAVKTSSKKKEKKRKEKA